MEFKGGTADAHRIDALQLGQSLSGISRVYNSIGHLHFHGEFQYSEHSQVRLHVSPPEEGSIFYLIYMMLVHGSLPTYPEVYFDVAEVVIPTFFKAIIGRKSGQEEVVEKCLDIIEKQHHDYARLAESNQEQARETQGQLLRIVDKLTDRNARSLADVASAVGRSVDEIQQLPEKVEPILIDAPIAETLRAPEELTVGETRTYHGKMTAIDKETGNFKFVEADSGAKLTGKITDPLVKTPENIYTHAFDTDASLEITGKPTFKENGDLHKIFVSDGKNVE